MNFSKLKFFLSSEKDSSILRIYDSRGSSQPIHKIEKLHYHPVHLIKVGKLGLLKKKGL